MKIQKVEATVLSVELLAPVRDSSYSFPSRSCVLVRVSTDEGLVGIGDASCFGGPPVVTQTIVEKEMAGYVLGEDPWDVEKLWDRMYRRSLQHGRKGAVIAALSGIDVALWDLRGKIANQPLAKLLGSFTTRVPAYASAGFYAPGKDTGALVDEVQKSVADGFRTVKMKIGLYAIREDMERVKAVRKALGEEIGLMVDANGKYLPKTAIRVGRQLEDYDVMCFEEPISPDDLEGYTQVARALDVPIAAGESEFCKYGFRDLIKSRAIDIAQPDVTWSGGITECKKIAAIAEAWNIPIMPHGWSTAINLAATLHFVASIPNGLLVEFDRNYNPLRTELIEEPMQLASDGMLEVPRRPGLGVTLNEAAVRKYRVVD